MKELQFIAILAILGISIINLLKLNKVALSNSEILAKLQEANEVTNEIAADLQDLIDNSGVSQEVADRLNEHVERLKGVAATHTPGSTGGGEPTP